MKNKFYYIIIALLVLLGVPYATRADNKATVFHPITGDRKIVIVGDYHAFDGGYLLETGLNNFEHLAAESIMVASDNPDNALGYSVVTRYRSTLTSSMTSSQNTIPVSSVNTFDGHTLTMTDLGDIAYLTLEPGTSREEIVSCTGISSTTWTGCTRGLAFYGTSTTAVTANKKAHNAGSIIVMSNVHYVYEQLTDKDTDQTLTGLITFGQLPLVPTSTPTLNNQLASWYIISNLVNQGAATATESLAGIARLATQAQMGAGTDLGFDIPLVLQSKYASSTASTTGMIVPIAGSDGKLDQSFIDLTEDYTWSGSQTFNGKMVNTKTSYVATASTTLTGATLPQPVYASSTLSNAILLSQATTTISTTAPVFEGFAISNATNGNSVYVQTEGVVSGFTGLTIGADYYIGTTTEGVITVNVPTNSFPIVKVGKAISATELMIERSKSFVGSATVSANGSSGVPINVYATSTIPWYVNEVVSNIKINNDSDNGSTRDTILTAELLFNKYSKVTATQQQNNDNGTATVYVTLTGTWNTTTGNLVWVGSGGNECIYTGTLYFYK